MIELFSTIESLKNDLDKVVDLMQEAVVCHNKRLEASIKRMLAKTGKLVRPGLVVIGARYAYEEHDDPEAWTKPMPESILRLAAAVELLHTASIIHDDIVDQALLRRHMPSLLALHGAGDAVLIGDLVMASGLRLVADLAEKNEVSQALEVVNQMIQAQMRQSDTRDYNKLSVRNYLHQIAGKTAILISLSLRAGAQKNGASQVISQAVQRIGWNMGMAFQIVDDLLDFSESQTKDKPAFSDIKAGIMTLPVLLALKQSPVSASTGLELNLQRKLAKALEKKRLGKGAIRKIVRWIKDLNGFLRAHEWAQRYSARAKRALVTLKEGQSKHLLGKFLDQLISRNN